MDPIQQADALKAIANKFFVENKYQQALDYYSQAIELNPNSAILFGNRAFAHLKLENYGTAIEDATKAIEIDPKYIKAYYRRGAANVLLGKHQIALKDFKQVTTFLPRDKDAKDKYNECLKAVRRAKFEEAIASEKTKPVSETIDLANIVVEESYDGLHMPAVLTPEWVKSLLAYFKDQKKLHKKYVIQLLLEVKRIFLETKNLVDITVPEGAQFTVCGDVHGQYYDLLNIWELNGHPSEENPYLFNGDFVDRGSFSLEVIVALFSYKVLYPNHFHLSRGNHESKNMNLMYGFEGEVKAKYNETVYALFQEIFCYVPLGAVLNKKVFVVHGGLFSRDDVTLDEINKLDRFREPPEDGLMSEMLWSDPQPFPGRMPSKRGVGLSFGPDVTKRFLENNNLELLVRSHEVKDDGYHVEHDGKCITIFSAPNYCDQMGNKGAFIKFKADMKPNFVTFTAVPHPSVRPMAYANSMLS
jgi:serine/threonine-protein phosphatase 5